MRKRTATRRPAARRKPVRAERGTAPRRPPADRRLRALVVVLVGFGLVMVYSASSVLALAQHGSSTVFFKSQATKAVVGLVLMGIVSWVDYRIWKRLAKPLLWISIAMLAVLALPLAPSLTPEINGARRWIAIPGLTFQPVEVAKLALVVWMSTVLVRRANDLDRGFEPLVPLLAVPLGMAGLVLLQPDFKGAFIIGSLAIVLLFLGGVRLRLITQIGAAAVPLGALILVLEPYRMRRLMAFFDSDVDAQGISYQINQSLISLGSGGWFGVGLGSSKQKFAFLPMAHTDFIVSIVGEELGVVGTLFLLLAFLYLGALGYRIARRAPDAFGFLLGSAITTLLLASAVMNIGVATAVLPTTGLPLPFVSYGGTALIVHLVAVGILLSISRDGVDRPKPASEPRSRASWWRKVVPGGRW